MTSKLKPCVNCARELPPWKKEGSVYWCMNCWRDNLAKQKLQQVVLQETRPARIYKHASKPLPKFSKKKRSQDSEYSKLRKLFLSLPTNSSCRAGFPGCTGGREEYLTIHHKKGRGVYYLETSTWVTLCFSCHEYVHNHPSLAQELDLMQSRLQTKQDHE